VVEAGVKLALLRVWSNKPEEQQNGVKQQNGVRPAFCDSH